MQGAHAVGGALGAELMGSLEGTSFRKGAGHGGTAAGSKSLPWLGSVIYTNCEFAAWAMVVGENRATLRVRGPCAAQENGRNETK